MVRTKIAKETKARYATSTRREGDTLSKRFVLRNATPAQVRLLRRNVALYEKFAKHLEREHKGEYVAIGLDGALVVGSIHVEVLQQAVEKFGAGNFALWKIGYDYALKWR